MKRLVSLFCLFLLFNSITFGSNWSLISSITNSGDSTGGIRYDFGNNIITDGGVTYHKNGNNKKEASYWADIYYKNIGLYISGNESSKLDYALMYSVEQAITEKITLGVGVRLIDQNNNDKLTQYLTTWDGYLVLNI